MASTTDRPHHRSIWTFTPKQPSRYQIAITPQRGYVPIHPSSESGARRSGRRPSSGRGLRRQLAGRSSARSRRPHGPRPGRPRAAPRSPASSSTGTFSAIALSYLLPGLSPTTTKPVFFDTEPLTLPPRRGDRLGRLVPGVTGQGAGDHHGQAVQRPRAGLDPLVGHPHPGRPPLPDDLAVPVDGEPLAQALRDRRPHTVHRGQRVDDLGLPLDRLTSAQPRSRLQAGLRAGRLAAGRSRARLRARWSPPTRRRTPRPGPLRRGRTPPGRVATSSIASSSRTPAPAPGRVGPTCRIDSATQHPRTAAAAFASSRLASILAGVGCRGCRPC